MAHESLHWRLCSFYKNIWQLNSFIILQWGYTCIIWKSSCISPENATFSSLIRNILLWEHDVYKTQICLAICFCNKLFLKIICAWYWFLMLHSCIKIASCDKTFQQLGSRQVGQLITNHFIVIMIRLFSGYLGLISHLDCSGMNKLFQPTILLILTCAQTWFPLEKMSQILPNWLWFHLKFFKIRTHAAKCSFNLTFLS